MKNKLFSLLLAFVLALGTCQAQTPVYPVVPVIVQKAHNNVGGTSVKTLSTTLSSTRAGDSLVVGVGAGEVVGSNIVLTVTDTNSDVCNLIVTQAISTTFAGSLYHCPNITAGNTAATVTFSGSSSANTTIATQVWEVAVPPGMALLFTADQFSAGTATSTTPSSGFAGAGLPNELAFGVFGVGTGAQTVTIAGTGTWLNDSGQINPTSASGLFSFVGVSQQLSIPQNVTAAGAITSEPWVAVVATFKATMLTADRIVCPFNYVQNGFTSSGNTQFAPLFTGRSVAVCQFIVNGAGTTANTVKLTTGTGSSCGTGTADLSIEVIVQAPTSVSPVGMVDAVPPNAILTTPVSQQGCLNLSGATAVNIQILWGYL